MDGLVQDCGNSSALAMELPKSGIKPLHNWVNHRIMAIPAGGQAPCITRSSAGMKVYNVHVKEIICWG